MKRVAIIGSGLNGRAGLQGLLDSQQNSQITIFDSEIIPGSGKNKISASSEKGHVAEAKKDFIVHGTSKKVISRLPSSLVRGGWGNYWGATMAPWDAETLSKANLDINEFSKAYTAVGNFMTYQADLDLLSERFPLYGSVYSRGSVSKISKDLLDRFEIIAKKDDSLPTKFLLGHSRLAINKLDDSSLIGCTQCGMCLSGCPYSHIKNSYFSTTFEKNKNIDVLYINSIVNRIQLINNKVTVWYSETYSDESLDFDEVYIAAGAVESLNLLINSNLVEKARFFETPLIFVPLFVRKRKTYSSDSWKRISLSELFVYFFSQNGLDAAGQIYELNSQVILKSPLRFIGSLKFVTKFLQSKFMVLMLFLPPTPHAVGIMCHKNGEIISDESPSSLKHYRKILSQIKQNFRQIGVYPFITKILFQPIGQSFHYAKGEVWDQSKQDYLPISSEGKLPNWSKDLPITVLGNLTLPLAVPGPITFTAMANSYRITSML